MLSLVDGAQSFGLLDVDLAAIQPDFYTGSAHKWPCGARECGVLLRQQVGPGQAVAEHLQRLPRRRRLLEDVRGLGQRDEATMIALREALAFQTRVGRAGHRAARPRSLGTQLVTGLGSCPASRVWTSPEAEHVPRRLVPAGNARRQQAGGGALCQRRIANHHARRTATAPACASRRTLQPRLQEVRRSPPGRPHAGDEGRGVRPRSGRLRRSGRPCRGCAAQGRSGWSGGPDAPERRATEKRGGPNGGAPAPPAWANSAPTSFAGRGASRSVSPSRHAAWPTTRSADQPTRRRSADAGIAVRLAQLLRRPAS